MSGIKFFRGIVPIMSLIMIFMCIASTYQISAKTIGTQLVIDTPNGRTIRCPGNHFYPHVTVCTGTNSGDIIVEPLMGGTIFGFKGDDRFRGLLGSAVVFGGDGDDVIQGGNGTATLFGNEGNDVIIGSAGPNFVYGGGASFLYGGKGNDQLIGGSDYEVMEGGPGSDLFVCKGKSDLIVDFNAMEDKKEGNCILL